MLLAVPWKNVEAAFRGLPEWNGRVLIDATNPFAETSPKLVLADLGGTGASEIVAGFAPAARIVKAFNSIRIAHFNEGPVKRQGRRVIFVSDAACRVSLRSHMLSRERETERGARRDESLAGLGTQARPLRWRVFCSEGTGVTKSAPSSRYERFPPYLRLPGICG